MIIKEIDKSVLEEIEDVIDQRDKMYENHIATTKKLTDGIEKLYEQEIKKLRNQLQQKENIIKEVREYIDRYEINSIGTPLTYTQLGKELLEILDKEVN